MVVNAKGLQIEYAIVLHEPLFVPVLMCCSETMIQMDNLRYSVDIRKMDKVSNAQMRLLCGVTKKVGEMINGVLRWFGHVKRIIGC